MATYQEEIKEKKTVEESKNGATFGFMGDNDEVMSLPEN